MPPAPEVLQRPGAVRPVEVLRELEAEELGHADRDVGVPAEVGVDHDRVSPDREQRLDRAVTRGIAEHRIDDRRRQEARHHHLLEQAAEDQPRGASDVDVPWVASHVELRDQLVRSHDRPGDQVREERQVQVEVDPARRLRVAPLDVHDVCDRHEREERDPDGQDHLEQRRAGVDAQSGEPVRHVDGEEAVVLEVRERGERGHDRDRHHESPPGRLLLLRDREPADLGDRADPRQQPHEVPVPPGVEDVARRDHEELPRQRARVQEPVAQEDQAEEDGEIDRGEEHRRATLEQRVRLREDAAPGMPVRADSSSTRGLVRTRRTPRRCGPSRRSRSARAEWNR